MTRLTWAAVAACSLMLLPAPATAQIGAGYQEYYVAGRSSQVFNFMNAVYRQGHANADLPDVGLVSVIGLVATLDGQTIYYDHWEDGYDANPFAPGSTTEVYTLSHGQALSLASSANCTNAKTCYVPRTRGTALRYDGGDRIVSVGGPINLVVNMYPITTDQMGGAWEVYARQTLTGSREYRIPVGVDLYPGTNNAYYPFQFVDLEVVSYVDNNDIVVDNGLTTVSLTLQHGQSYSTRGFINETGAASIQVRAGTTITSTGDMQVGILTGQQSEFRSDLFTAIPVKLWGRDYVVPILGGSSPVNVYLFNPNPVNINVTLIDNNTTFTGVIPARSARSWRELAGQSLRNNSGARVVADRLLWGVVDVDYTATGHDWGFSLMPSHMLKTEYYVSWSPTDLTPIWSDTAGSPVWVTPFQDGTTVRVDFNRDNVWDSTFTLNTLNVQRVYDSVNATISNGDNAGTHFLADAPVALAYGEDHTAPGSSPGLDLGYTVLPLAQDFIDPIVTVDTSASDTIVSSAGGSAQMVARIARGNYIDVNDVDYKASFPSGITYVPGSTTVDGFAVPDPVDTVAGAVRTLDWQLNQVLNSGSPAHVVRYRLAFGAALANQTYTVFSTAHGIYGVAELWPTDTHDIAKTFLVVDKRVNDSSAPVDTPVVFTLDVRNISTATDAVNVVVRDTLPEGLEYVSATGSATYSATTRTVTWNLGAVNRNTSVMGLTLTANLRFVPGKTVANNVARLTTDTIPSAIIYSPIVPVTVELPAVAVTASPSAPSPFGNGDVITYTVVVANGSAVGETNVYLTDLIPAGTVYVAGSMQVNTGSGFQAQSDGTGAPADYCDFDVSRADAVTCLFATFPAGASYTLRFQVRCNTVLPVGTQIIDIATAEGNYTLPTNSNSAVVTYDSTCGDSYVHTNSGETCDDGNTTAGDGCSAACVVEGGYNCTGTPSLCTAICGDGQRRGAEGCDDNNTTSGDGCSSTCKIENGSPCNQTAPGALGNASCLSTFCDTASGPPGTCRPLCGNGMRETGEGCDDGNTTAGDGCNAICRVENGSACNATAPGLTGNASCASGVCDTVGNAAPGRCEAANSCGNGTRDANEGCDDGNTTAGDGCDAACRVQDTFLCNQTAPGLLDDASCASGICDTLGNALPGRCEPTATCGNSVLEANEGCDDGNLTAGDGCNGSCRVETGGLCNATAPGLTGSASCASGVCDTLGNAAPGRCEAANTCGNGAREANEGCDDGNLTAGDGCNATCRAENGAPCNATAPGLTGNASCASGVCDAVGNAAPGRCEAANTCGNGARETNEGCDDGNVTAGDGCNATCRVENGSACNATTPGLTGGASCASGVCDTLGNAAPGRCEAANTCGNGAREANEGCDDGGTTAGGGCSATCRIENQNPCNQATPGLTGNTSCASGFCYVGAGLPGTCNAAPAFSTTGGTTATEDVGYSYRPTITDDAPAGNVTVTLTADSCGGTWNGTTYSFTPTGPTPPASCSYTLHACDAQGACTDQTTNVTITAVNDAPAFTSTGPVDATEDTLYSYRPGLSDPDGPAPLTTTLTANGCGGVWDGVTYTFTPMGPTPPAGCSFTLHACDNQGACTDQVTTVVIAALNDVPVFSSTGPTAATEDQGYTYSPTVTDADGPGPVTTTLGDNGCGGAWNGSTYVFNPAGPTPPASCSYTLQACDASTPAVCTDQTTTVIITAVNDAPVVGNDTAQILGAAGGDVNVLANDSDPEGDSLSVTTITQGTHGTVTIVGSGTAVHYTPAPGYVGTDTFTYTVSDGHGGSTTATVTVTVVAVCGNGVIETGETCDDANAASGDGCSATCANEPGWTCTGTPSACTTSCGDGAKAGAEACDDGNNAPGDGCGPTCSVEPGWSCSGTPSTCVTGCGDGVKAGTEGCDDGNVAAGDGCSPICGVEPGWSCNGAPSTCTTSCGDGVKAGAEQCDDGDLEAGDGCDASCKVETGWQCTGSPSVCTAGCGDGIRAGVEACDDGNTAPGDGCSAACTVEPGWTCAGAAPATCTTTCGDGIQAGLEACDDANSSSGDGCSATCTVEPGFSCAGTPSTCVTGCGDGARAGTEGCDDGNTVAGDGCSPLCQEEPGWTCTGAPSACLTTCGDGISAGDEACDDGNATAGDGCSALCTVEPGWTCAGDPSACATLCGDGVKAGAEQCDDGNGTGGDGCSATCAQETGWTCTGTTPSVCDTICGDGVKANVEGCDDGNTAAGDGCSASCTTEPGWSCTGVPSACTTTCGDGVKAGAEACDDGNNAAGDGCGPTCSVEPGWSCSGTPSTCVTGCGDGVKAGAEGCDDGNVAAGDGCSPICVVEPGWNCTGTPSACATSCGDGETAGAEQCDDGDLEAGDGCDASCTVETGWQCTGSPSVCTAGCGDGTKAGAEACDDGNTAPGDGCSATCTVEPGWTCNGASPSACVTTCGDGVLAGLEACDDGNNAAGDGCSATCTVETGWSCAGTPSTCVTGCGDNAIAGTEGCDDGNTVAGDGCSPLCQVEPGWTCIGTPSTCDTACGDGVSAGDEACDDGNTAAGDGCSATCAVEPGWTCAGNPSACATTCGDGVKAGAEQCDDGNGTGGDGCSPTCAQEPGWTCTGTPSTCDTTCGDGIKANVEACDDGDTEPGDGCSATCTVEPGWSCTGSPSVCTAGCGDGVKASSEGCDDGNLAAGDGCSATCTVEPGWTCTGTTPSACSTTCGDGVKVGAEGCDDGDLEAGDGCSPTCTVEPGWNCTGSLSICTATCGDGVKAGAEGCDDGDLEAGDGCSATCTVEPGWSCTGTAPSTCSTTCGDGVKAGAEACDDGDLEAGDGCSATCAVEPGWSCTGETPSKCTVGCGDGVKAGAEACDDGNSASGDGCSASCAVEPGWTCDGASPSKCTAICGDGTQAGTEACDDGNTAAGDGCSASCSVEPGWTCTDGSAKSECAPVCGDGTVLGAETCDDGNTAAGDGCSAACLVEDGWTCDQEPSACEKKYALEGGCGCASTGGTSPTFALMLAGTLLVLGRRRKA
ncbi:MAG: DUF4215 domain-containing protein [Myxococcales bacterium]